MWSKKVCDCVVSTITESVLCPAPPSSFLRSCGEADPCHHAGMRSASIHRFSRHRGWTTPATPVRVLARRSTFDMTFEYLSISIVAQSAKTYFETRSESCAGYMYFCAFLSFRWLIYICMCASSLEDLIRHGLHDLLRKTLPQDKESCREEPAYQLELFGLAVSSLSQDGESP